jgi:hypothetical protein
MFKVVRILGVAGILATLGCGGGGGGSSTGDYTGTWDVNAVRLINDCGLNVSATFSSTILVNQDGSRIVVDSGSRVLQGSVNERDGFTVADTLPTSNGCQGGAAYSFSDASDGDADVGVALLLRCGNRQCSVGYGGRGVRRDRKMAQRSATDGADERAILQALDSSSVGSEGTDPQGTTQEDVASMAELVAPVQ